MSQRYEWAQPSEGPRLIEPNEVTELADDGNPDGYTGLAWGGCMVYGTPDELRATLRAALEHLDAGLPKAFRLPPDTLVTAHSSKVHDGLNVEIDAPAGLRITVHVNDGPVADLVVPE